MTKNFFVFLILILFIGGAVWLLLQKKDQVAVNDLESSSATPASSTASSVMATTRPDGLVIEDLQVGAGETAIAGKIVAVHYTGTLVSGQKFDSSRDRGEPFQFILGGGMVIKGWDEGVQGMKVGGKRKLTIPPALAYGASGAPARDQQGNVIPNQYVIPPNSTLIFDIELLGVQTPR